MKRNAIITMTSIQSIHGDSTETELLTKGLFKSSGDSFDISYEDSEATGFEGSVTEISVKADRYASVIRKGSSSSDLIMEKGKKHHCQFGTPYGAMDIGIYTHYIKNDLSENGGTLHMKYTLDINSTYMSDNEIIVKINLDK